MTPPRKRAETPPPAEEEPGRITTRQMRELHAVLREHGITGDKAVHDYLTAALTELGADPVESRADLDTVLAARIITDAETAEVHQTRGARATTSKLRALREPFPEEAIGHLPRLTCKACRESQRKCCEQHQWVSRCQVCNGSHSSATIHITYVGHADVTARLLEVDPEWTWEPMAVDPTGHPVLDRAGGLWIRLTVLGVTRPGYGDSENGKGVKEAIGDALRNAAMRFGVALDLWAKGDREWAHAEKTGSDQHPDEAPPRQDAPPPPYVGPTTAELLASVDSYATRLGVTYEKATEKWRDRAGTALRGSPFTLDELDSLDPQVVAELETWIANYWRSQQEQNAADTPTAP